MGGIQSTFWAPTNTSAPTVSSPRDEVLTNLETYTAARELDEEYRALLEEAIDCFDPQILARLAELGTLQKLRASETPEDRDLLNQMKQEVVIVEGYVASKINNYDSAEFDAVFGAIQTLLSPAARVVHAHSLLGRVNAQLQRQTILALLCDEMLHAQLSVDEKQQIMETLLARRADLTPPLYHVLVLSVLVAPGIFANLEAYLKDNAAAFGVDNLAEAVEAALAVDPEARWPDCNGIEILTRLSDDLEVKRAIYASLYPRCDETIQGQVYLFGIRHELLHTPTAEEAICALKWYFTTEGEVKESYLVHAKAVLSHITDADDLLEYTVRLDAYSGETELLTTTFGSKHTPPQDRIETIMAIIREANNFALFVAFFDVLNTEELDESVRWPLEYLGLELCTVLADGRSHFDAISLVDHILDNDPSAFDLYIMKALSYFADRDRQIRRAVIIMDRDATKSHLCKSVITGALTQLGPAVKTTTIDYLLPRGDLREALFACWSAHEKIFAGIQRMNDRALRMRLAATFMESIDDPEMTGRIGEYLAAQIRATSAS